MYFTTINNPKKKIINPKKSDTWTPKPVSHKSVCPWQDLPKSPNWKLPRRPSTWTDEHTGVNRRWSITRHRKETDHCSANRARALHHGMWRERASGSIYTEFKNRQNSSPQGSGGDFPGRRWLAEASGGCYYFISSTHSLHDHSGSMLMIYIFSICVLHFDFKYICVHTLFCFEIFYFKNIILPVDREKNPNGMWYFNSVYLKPLSMLDTIFQLKKD